MLHGLILSQVVDLGSYTVAYVVHVQVLPEAEHGR
jgi:hypothetical protein